MEVQYDAEYLKRYYDAYGMKEWYRLERNAEAKVSFFLHQHYLLQHIQRGYRVLEIGAGPGRFTLELAALGAKIVVLDISPEQLRLNKRKMEQEAQLHAVEQWVEGDVTDLSAFSAAEFDAVVCYGGPLSYVGAAAPKALTEMFRVVRADGPVLLSVMSLLGTTRRYMPSIVELAFQYGLDQVDRVTRTGDLIGAVAQNHHCHMFRWAELRQLLTQQPCEIIAASASGFLVLQDPDANQIAENNLDLWEKLLQWELFYCSQPGAIDCGTHIIAVTRKL
jgi:ubiquinone/menaquinone biosynthesis C-methylase UbiE